MTITMKDTGRELLTECPYGILPKNMVGALERFLWHQIPPGHFLQAVLKNDLADAINRADNVSRMFLGDIVVVLNNHYPATCWGSVENYENWLKK